MSAVVVTYRGEIYEWQENRENRKAEIEKEMEGDISWKKRCALSRELADVEHELFCVEDELYEAVKLIV